MSSDGGVAVAGVAHVPAWKKLGLKLKHASDLPVGQGQKRKASEAEDEDGNGAEGRSISKDNSSKKGKKRSKRGKRGKRERLHESSGEDEGSREKKEGENCREGEERKKEKKKRKGTRNKNKDSGKTSDTEDADASLSDRDKATSPPPALVALSSPPESNNTASSPNGSPSKPSLRKRTAEEKRLLRKSVTFTSDTKATDGDSIKTLYQNYDPFAHYDSYQQHISNYPTNELPEGFDDIRPKFESTGKRKKFDDEEEEKANDQKKPEQEKKKRQRKAKKSKKEQGGLDKEDGRREEGGKSENVKPQLSYLLTYHTCREAWKFEKSKQNWILRNTFDPSMIPEEGYADALKSYIAGIQGTSARDRLLSEANEIVKHGNDTISKDGDKLDAMDQKNNVKRAKLVLAALGHGDDEDEEEDESDSSDEE